VLLWGQCIISSGRSFAHLSRTSHCLQQKLSRFFGSQAKLFYATAKAWQVFLCDTEDETWKFLIAFVILFWLLLWLLLQPAMNSKQGFVVVPWKWPNSPPNELHVQTVTFSQGKFTQHIVLCCICYEHAWLINNKLNIKNFYQFNQSCLVLQVLPNERAVFLFVEQCQTTDVFFCNWMCVYQTTDSWHLLLVLAS